MKRALLSILLMYGIATAVVLILSHYFDDHLVCAGIFFCVALREQSRRPSGRWCAAAGICALNLLEYIAHKNHHARAEHDMHWLGNALFIYWLFGDYIDKLFKKLWRKTKSAGLTYINELSFRRQSKEAFR